MSSINSRISTCFIGPQHRPNDRSITDHLDTLMMAHTIGTKDNHVPGTNCSCSVFIRFTHTALYISQVRKLRRKEIIRDHTASEGCHIRMLNAGDLAPAPVLRADTRWLLDLVAFIDFSNVWFCKSYTFPKEICNSECHVCITGY